MEKEYKNFIKILDELKKKIKSKENEEDILKYIEEKKKSIEDEMYSIDEETKYMDKLVSNLK